MKFDDIALWFFSLIGGMALCGARLGWFLFRVSPLPPDDPVALAMWQRKRRWLVYSELSALPGFATISLIVGRLQAWPLEGVILLSMVLGALGFAFFLDALQTLVRKHIALEGNDRG